MPNPNNPPLFVLRFMENVHKRFGPILCWPDGEIVPGQCFTSLDNPVGALQTVTIKLFVGTGVVDVEYGPLLEEDSRPSDG